MKKIISLLIIFTIIGAPAFGLEPDYRQIYMDQEVPTFSYIHGLDPGQYYDNEYATYSVYPLLRLSAPLYFKTITILPGFYDLTPREYEKNYYMLFKQNGIVKYTIPIYKRELVPQGFYESHIPKKKKKPSEKFFDFIRKHFKNAKLKVPVQTYLELNDVDNNFFSIVFYFGDYRYYAILRKVQM